MGGVLSQLTWVGIDSILWDEVHHTIVCGGNVLTLVMSSRVATYE